MRETTPGLERRPESGRLAASRSRFSTRRRLIAAFSAVLVAFLSALAFQVFALRRMETTFAVMEEFLKLMRHFHGNVTKAAERAGMTRESLYRVLKKYDVRSGAIAHVCGGVLTRRRA